MTETDGRGYFLSERKIRRLKDFSRECGRYSLASRACERFTPNSALRLPALRAKLRRFYIVKSGGTAKFSPRAEKHGAFITLRSCYAEKNQRNRTAD